MTQLLIFFMLFFTASAIALISRHKIDETVACSCLLFILTLYVFAVFQILFLGIYACIIISALSMIYFIVYIAKTKELPVKNIFTPGLLVFVLFFFWAWFINRNRLLSSWDEFSHWGLVVKNMCIFDNFGSDPQATTIFKSYPPGISLFQYLWCKLYGSYQEGHLINALNILSFSLLLPVFKNINWERKKFIIPVMLIILTLPCMFYNWFYNYIYVDPILGLFFAFILVSYFTSDKFDLFCLISIMLSACVLTLVKASGLWLAIIACSIIIIDLLLFRTKKEQKSIFAILLSIILGKYSWYLYVTASNLSPAWSGMKNITFANLVLFIQGRAPEYRYSVYRNFVNAIIKNDFCSFIFHMSYILWNALFVVVGLLSIFILKERLYKLRTKTAVIGLFCGSLVYSASMLVLYMFTFSEYEALKLASFERYMGTYLLGVIVFLLSVFIFNVINETTILNKKNSASCVLGILLGVIVFTNFMPLVGLTFFHEESLKSSLEFRSPYEKINRISNLLDSKKDRLYFVSQNNNGIDFCVARYCLTPIKLNSGSPWSVGVQYGTSDIWTVNISQSQFANDLARNYTYVYLYKIDSQFENKFGDLFEDKRCIKNDSLYRIIKVNNEVKLEFINQNKNPGVNRGS